MKTSETKNKSGFDCSAWSTREELERLIKLAPTAIHRQSLQQQLMAMEEADGSFEKTGVSVEDDTTVKKADESVEGDDTTVKKVDESVEGDHTTVEKANVSVEDDTTVKKVGVSAEQNRFLEQGKQADKSYAAMQRRSRLSPVKIILLATAIILMLASSVVLIRPDIFTVEFEELAAKVKSDAQVYMDTAMEYVEAFKHSVQTTFLQIKTMVLEDEPIDVPSSVVTVAESMVETTVEIQNSVLNMYKAKSLALDSILKFDNFIELNGMPRPLKEAEIKTLLHSAQSHQQYGQYNKAIASYHQVSAELESLMNMTQQLIVKQRAAELARLSWESYRWNFHRDAQNLPLTSEESTLVDLENETNTMTHDGIVQRAIIGYEDIEHQYVELLGAVKGVAKARASVELVQQQWYQFRDRYNLNSVSIPGIEKAYRRGIKLELAGAFQDAIDSYEVAGNRYKKALEEGSIMVAKRNNAKTTKKERK